MKNFLVDAWVNIIGKKIKNRRSLTAYSAIMLTNNETKDIAKVIES